MNWRFERNVWRKTQQNSCREFLRWEQPAADCKSNDHIFPFSEETIDKFYRKNETAFGTEAFSSSTILNNTIWKRLSGPGWVDNN